MAAHLRKMARALFTVALLMGTLSAGAPIPQNVAMEMPPSVEATPVQQPNAENVMTGAPQSSQKVDAIPSVETAPGMTLVVPQLTPTLIPTGEVQLTGTPISETPITPPVVQQALQALQQPAAPVLSRPDCPEMSEENEQHTVVCQDDDKKDDVFQLMTNKEPVPVATPPVVSPPVTQQ